MVSFRRASSLTVDLSGATLLGSFPRDTTCSLTDGVATIEEGLVVALGQFPFFRRLVFFLSEFRSLSELLFTSAGLT